MATIQIPNFLTPKTEAGLNTYQYTIVNAGMHICRMEIYHHESSNLTATISQSGSVSSTLATMTVQPVTIPSTTAKSAALLTAIANCQPGDVISLAVTSSTPVDQGLNNVKSTFIVAQGLTT